MNTSQSTLFGEKPQLWLAYTDGACSGNPGPCAWGAVVIEPGAQNIHREGVYIGQGTNQIAELTAAIEGLARTPVGATVKLVSDSQYVLKGLTEWRAGWERRGMRTADGSPVKNVELFKRLYKVADERKVTVQWVKGHNGDQYNEEADKLATSALKAGRPK
jgi:ribonuclease HI